jgi:hypothetical protein
LDTVLRVALLCHPRCNWFHGRVGKSRGNLSHETPITLRHRAPRCNFKLVPDLHLAPACYVDGLRLD